MESKVKVGSKVSVVVSLIVMLGILLTGGVSAEGPTAKQKAENAITNRQAVFKLIYFNLGPIAGMARGKVEFDATIAERNARRIAAMAPMIPELFGAMDTRGINVHTDALPKIWDQPDDFSTAAQKLADAATRFADIAAKGDKRSTLGAFRGLGGACGSCHDSFRVDDD